MFIHTHTFSLYGYNNELPYGKELNELKSKIQNTRSQRLTLTMDILSSSRRDSSEMINTDLTKEKVSELDKMIQIYESKIEQLEVKYYSTNFEMTKEQYKDKLNTVEERKCFCNQCHKEFNSTKVNVSCDDCKSYDVLEVVENSKYVNKTVIGEFVNEDKTVLLFQDGTKLEY